MPNINNLKGKKLLFLGTNAGTCEMVKYAKSKGVYTILTDNLPVNESAAKRIVDEKWMISTDDIDAIVELVNKKHIHGVFAGVSEFNLDKAILICERLNLPFYASKSQWIVSRDKELFKKKCREYGIPASKGHCFGLQLDIKDLVAFIYPVIVKPADNSGSKGVAICYSDKEVLFAYKKALCHSIKKKVLVEEYIDGEEIAVYYTLKDGEVRISCMMDRYLNDKAEHLPRHDISIGPSKYLNEFINGPNNSVINFLSSEGFNNGAFFIQGKIKDNSFIFFEIGFRLPAGLYQKFSAMFNKINVLEMLVNYSLVGEMGCYDLSLENPFYNMYCATVNIFSSGGFIHKISGIEEIRNNLGVIDIVFYKKEGDVIKNDSDGYYLDKAVMRVYIISKSKEELIDKIEEVYKKVDVVDNNGNSIMCDHINIGDYTI